MFIFPTIDIEAVIAWPTYSERLVAVTVVPSS